MRPNSISFNLEPTFRCNLECPMCPRFSSEDPHLDMSMETFGRIHDAMECAHTVDFTGWGEPTLHPDIYRMIQMAREQDCVTTMTSNGTTLTEKNSRRLIEAGLNRLAVSVDGMQPETYEPLRIGATFEKLTRNLTRMAARIDSSRSPLELAIAFTIQEHNAADLDRIVGWMGQVGARVLHLKQLNVISNEQDWKNTFLKYRLHPSEGDPSALDRLEKRILRLRDQAERAGIRFEMHSEFPLSSRLEGRHCLATPLESVYFSYEGRVPPCCHFGHHVSRYYEGAYSPPDALFFGDIRTRNLEDIWTDPEFQVFRRGFADKDFPEACQSCYLLYGK